ncbi:uncharacterized protein LOC111813287 isoform X2 [Octodon degus]|uniref:Uncharacterized protein LOC111813287 isoform X2 n=1 Tax=Octodon degus TaxID=10160 RepID=A0A6P6DHR3_OCTDE|nr:uncharacterized protein LOC111813287 isoform X2 [Octodon degus]
MLTPKVPFYFADYRCDSVMASVYGQNLHQSSKSGGPLDILKNSNWRARISSGSSFQSRGRSTTHAGVRVSFPDSCSAMCTLKAPKVYFSKEENEHNCDCGAGAIQSRSTCTSGASLDCTHDHETQGFHLDAV